MILLSGHSLTQAAKLRPEALSVNLKERESSATIALENLTGITENSWMKSDKGPGNGTVWRVKSIQQTYHNKTATIQLEHAIKTLQDRVLFGEIRPAQITGTVGATTCTARQAIEYILNQQSDWVLYNFGYENVSNPYKFDGDSLLDALESVSATLEDAWWSYDMSVYPFRLNITARQSGVVSELRPGRNLRTISKSIDKAGMFTRFYPIGKNDLHLNGTPYLSRNENLYGIIAKIGTDQSRETEAELIAWANEQLNRHAEPVVTITAEGLEIAEATGETLDALTLGRNCRVPLNEFGTTITERIIELDYRDALFQPKVVRVTMSNKREDVTKIIADAIKGAGRSSRGTARRDKEDLAWFEDTNDHVAMVAKGIVGVDAQGNPNWVRLSQIIVDENGIDQTVTEMQGDVEISKTWITQNGSTVTAAAAKVTVLEDKSVELEGRLDLEAGQASLLVTATDNRPLKTYSSRSDFPATGSTSYLYYSLQDKKYYQWNGSTYTETTPGNEINRAGIIATINEDGTSTTKILGNKVLIGGAGTSVSLSDVMAITNNVAHIKKNAYFDQEVTIANTPSAGLNLYTLNFVGSSTYTLTPPDVGQMVKTMTMDDTTDMVTVTLFNGDTFSFRKAASAGDKISGSWNGTNTLSVGHSLVGENYFNTVITTGFKCVTTPGQDDQYYITSYHQDMAAQQPSETIGSSVRYTLGTLDATPNVVRLLNAAGTAAVSPGNTPIYTIPNPTVSGWSLGNCTAPYSYKPSVNINGTTYTSASALNAEGAYSNGWSKGLEGVELYRTPSTAIAYGTTYTVKAKAYPNKDASAKTDISGATLQIAVPSPSLTNWSLGSYSSPYTYKASVNVNGTTYTSGNLNAIDAYAKGWTNCYAGVQLDSTTAKTLNYGESVTVYAQAYSTKDATARTNKQSRTITAPADRYQTGYNDGYAAGYNVGDISVEYTGYSSNNKRYTITSGSGSSANCSMQVKMYAHNYSETDTWNAPVTNAYRDGYAAGLDAGGGSTPSYNTSFSSTGTFSTGTSPNDALKGWNPKLATGVPGKSQGNYIYIKFTVDGYQRSFYFT